MLVAVTCPAEDKQEHLSEKQLLMVLDCITRPSVVGIPKKYSGEGLRFRYTYTAATADKHSTMGLILYKAGGKHARYYMFYLDWSKECPVVDLGNGADLYREKGRWHSGIPFRVGGLGTMQSFAELPDEYAKEQLHFVPAQKIRRTCATYEDGVVVGEER
jgi:hypothetical protein